MLALIRSSILCTEVVDITAIRDTVSFRYAWLDVDLTGIVSTELGRHGPLVALESVVASLDSLPRVVRYLAMLIVDWSENIGQVCVDSADDSPSAVFDIVELHTRTNPSPCRLTRTNTKFDNSF